MVDARDGTVLGTDNDDLIDLGYTGDPEGDKIDAGDGTNGTAGDQDLVKAGAGNDTVWAGKADDTVYGEAGDDELHGEDGNDTLYGDGAEAVNLIQNGSFEDTTGLTQTGYGYFGVGGVPGWTSENPTHGIDVHNDERGSVEPADGENWVDLETTPGNVKLGQDVQGVETGETYTLTFSAGDRLTDDNMFKVWWNGELVEIDGETVHDPANGEMQAYTVTLIGGSGDGSNRLEFEGSGSENRRGVSIDNVSLVKTVEGGDDTIWGGDGEDTIYGGDGDDILYGDGGGASGGSGSGKGSGGGGDNCDTDVNGDTIYGGAGNDKIYGMSGNDYLSGGAGDDLIHGGDGSDTIDGGDGNDILFGDGSNLPSDAPNLIQNGSFEDVTGLHQTTFGFLGTGGVPGWTTENPDHQIDLHSNGRGGVDPADGQYWADLEATPGNIKLGQDVAGVEDGKLYVLTFSAGDRITDTNTFQVIWNGEVVEVKGEDIQDPVNGGMQNYTVVLTGGSGDGTNRIEFMGLGEENKRGVSIDNVKMFAADGGACAGDDTINGGDGDDVIFGGDGQDVIDGGDGDDIIYGDDSDGGGGSGGSGGSGKGTGGSGSGGSAKGTGGSGSGGSAKGTGGSGSGGSGKGTGGSGGGGGSNPDACTLTEGVGPNGDTIYGGAGNDTIFGMSGHDYLNGGARDDTIFGGTGNDHVLGGDGNDLLHGDDGSDAKPTGPNLIQNGSFEDVSGLTSVSYGHVGTGGVPGWTTTNDWAEVDIHDDDRNGVDPADGDNWADLEASPGNITLGQDVAGVADGKQYVLTFSAGDSPGQDNTFKVYWNGELVTIDGETMHSPTEGGMQEYTVTLVGGSGNGENRIEFKGYGSWNNQGIAIDAVSLHLLGDGDGGNDWLDGGSGDDMIFGDGGDDVLKGGTGDDYLDGGTGSDMVNGGDDRDFIVGGRGDTIDGGSGGDDFDRLAVDPDKVDWIEYTSADKEDGIVHFKDGTSLTFADIEAIVPCFTPGTLITTTRGEVPVETLKVGDKVVTRDNGLQEIRWTGTKALDGRQLLANPHLRPVLIRKGALGRGLPERDMMVSPNHRMLVSNDRTSLLFEEREVLVAAKHIIDRDGILQVDSVGVSYIHFMFDQHEVVLADGSWTESFQPGDYSLKGIGNSQRNEIFELFPDLRETHGRQHYVAARRTLKRKEARLLL